VNRRAFITLLGGVAAWSLAAHAQQSPMPVIGYLSVGAPVTRQFAVFKQSLAEAGFLEGRNVAVETPSAEGQYDRLPALAADLVRRQVAVIVAITANPALAAKGATPTIPIVFNIADDPVELGLVASLARPGGNATGVSFLFNDLVGKHLGLLRELLPRAARIGLLVNPQNANAGTLTKNATAAAASTGIEIIVLRASDAGAIEDAFTALTRQHQPAGGVSDDGPLYCPHSQGRQTCRPSSGAVDQVRFRHQHPDCPSAWSGTATDAARPRRRGDRMKRRIRR
jgi:putative tryptophan/tyrosine transport system substrate-binding protein